jgi:hypothetical protein
MGFRVAQLFEVPVGNEEVIQLLLVKGPLFAQIGPNSLSIQGDFIFVMTANASVTPRPCRLRCPSVGNWSCFAKAVPLPKGLTISSAQAS